MYRTKLHYISLSFLAILLFTACKKERGPRLIVAVVNQGAPVPGAIVRAWPGPDFPVFPNELDTAASFRQALTNADGEVTYDFELSVVLDVDVAYVVQETELDSSGMIITVNDTLRGRTVVQLERLLQREEENTTRVVVEVN